MNSPPRAQEGPLNPSDRQRFGAKHAALAICLGVGVIVGGVEAWLAVSSDPTAVVDDGAGVEFTSLSHSAVDLETPYGAKSHEMWVLFLLVAMRLLSSQRRSASVFEPVLDLPLIGVALAASGGGFSPLDPALPLAYVALIILLRSEDPDRRKRTSFVVRLVLGFLMVFGITSMHDRVTVAVAAEQPARFLEHRVAEFRDKYHDRIRALETRLDEDAPASVPEALSRLEEPPQRARRALATLLDGLHHCEDLRTLEELLEAQHSEELISVAKWSEAFTAFEVWWWNTLAEQPMSRQTYEAFYSLLVAWIDARELFAGIEHRGWRLVEEAKGLENYTRILERHRLTSDVRRLIQIPALLCFALLVMALAEHLRRAARQAQLERSRAARETQREEHRRELALGERETQNWIALTAGLTHGLGNDIVAYDIYLEDLLEQLDDEATAPAILDRLRFLRDSNKGRMSFLQFLEAFARQRKAKGEGRQPSFPNREVEFEPLLNRVREHLATVETADLPPRGTDPAVDRQLDRLRNLPLQVQVTDPSAAVLRHAHRGVVDFCAYELLKNALRNCSGERPLQAILRREGDVVVLRLVNDVEVIETRGRCACGREDVSLRRVRSRQDGAASCDRCFPDNLEALLSGSFAPGRGGGTGLGLFLIRYFLSAYYGGSIRTGIEDPAIPSVRFELRLPDVPPPPAPELADSSEGEEA